MTSSTAQHPLPHGLSIQIHLDLADATEIATEVSNGAVPGQIPAIVAANQEPETTIIKKIKAFPVKLGVTPFPNYAHPTREEVYEVHGILTALHGTYSQPKVPPMPSAIVAGCGHVPFVLEAVIRTIISAATSMDNANTAIRGLLSKFRVFRTGPYAGSVDWNQVRLATRQEVINALPGGVMPGMKARFIQETLQAVWEDNNMKREQLRVAMNLADSSLIPHEEVQKNSKNEALRTHKLTKMSNKTLLEHPSILTLDYMHAWDDADVFYGLQGYSGVGPKIAACVMLFCMQRPRFAVDTHCHRLCKWLGWVPDQNVNDHKTFAHCDVRIPDELKFSLHQLMIVHGKECRKCNGKDLAIQVDDADCPLEHLLNRTRAEVPSKKSQKRAPRSAQEDDEEANLPPIDRDIEDFSLADIDTDGEQEGVWKNEPESDHDSSSDYDP